jgi:RND superfamily putative drug exporter
MRGARPSEQDDAREATTLASTQRKVRLAAAVLVLLWIAVGGAGGPLVGKLSEVQKNDNASFLPPAAEATAVNNWIQSATDTSTLPFFVVVENTQGLGPSEVAGMKEFIAAVPGLMLPDDHSKKVGDYLAGPVQGAFPSTDRQALLLPVVLDAKKATERVGGKAVLGEVADALRTQAKISLTPAQTSVYVTGVGGFFADFLVAFAGIDGILLIVALGVVFVILLVVYRSPVLPVAVLITAMFGLSLAALVIYPLAKNDAIALSGQSQGILSILVVGASTDYALLLVSRYKEELHDHPSTWAAMRAAWRAAVQPIAASAATVILGLLCLRLSELGSTKGLGPVGAIGIAGAFVAALTFLPALLLLAGRRIFWPAIPRVDHVRVEDVVDRSRVWGRVARMVGQHPRRTWVLTLVGLLACAAFLPTFQAKGVTQSDFFLTHVESVDGQGAIARHFSAGVGSPVVIVAPEGEAQAALAVLKAEPGLTNAFVGETPGTAPQVVDGKVRVQATLVASADSVEAEQVIERLRGALDSVGTDVLVGGSTAINYDVRTASDRDIKVIIPAILAVIFIVLGLLLRSLVAPVLLVVANVLSFTATLGVSALVFNHVLHFPGSDPATPLYGFVFLVALGIDYSIFLMTRVREEAQAMATRPAVLVGLAVTGGVITSAGIVLASTFSALAILPILFLAQIAFIVGFGVLLDTLIVRSLLVPAVAHDLGKVTWWPSALSRRDGGDVAVADASPRQAAKAGIPE